MMRDLLEPVLQKGQKDRELILQLEKAEDGLVERIDMLETAVYKLNEGGGKTKFDEIADQILACEVKQRELKEHLTDRIDNFIRKTEAYNFEIDANLIQIKSYKE